MENCFISFAHSIMTRVFFHLPQNHTPSVFFIFFFHVSYFILSSSFIFFPPFSFFFPFSFLAFSHSFFHFSYFLLSSLPFLLFFFSFIFLIFIFLLSTSSNQVRTMHYCTTTSRCWRITMFQWPSAFSTSLTTTSSTTSATNVDNTSERWSSAL